MTNAWQLRFQPTLISITPQRGGTHRSVQIQPGKPVATQGSFQVVTAVRPRLTETNKGTTPLAAGTTAAAVVEFIAGPMPVQGPTTFVSLGTLRGRVDFNNTGTKTVPRFTAGTRRGPNNSSELDFTPATTFDVQNSDWVLRVEPDPDTFLLSVVSAFTLTLPWQFIENPGPAIMQLSARLTIGGVLAADENNNRNTPLDIPLRHLQVPNNAKPGEPTFTFFGLGTLYTRSNANAMPRVPFSGGSFNIILHPTFTDFCTQIAGVRVADVTAVVFAILSDAGFTAVNFLQGAAAAADCDLHWRPVGGHFIGRRINETDPSKTGASRLENRFSAAISANNPGTVSIPNGMEEILPFFSYYIFAEDADPPDPTELAHGELNIDSLVNPTAVTKAAMTPIVFAKGIGSGGSPLRRTLAKLGVQDRANLLGTTLVHEIGHSFGLRHSVALVGQPPYLTADPSFTRGTMGSAGLAGGTGPPTSPIGFFGPVHSQEIRRLFL